MESMFQMIQTLIACGAVLFLAFLILLAMPQSKLRSVLMPIVGWLVAIFCGFYAISPVDIFPEILFGPFGYVEDIAAVGVGFAAASAAIKAKED